MFHQANVHIPIALEKRLNYFLVTPRMHGIHHSIIEAQTNSNWSSGLTVWDKMHGTYRDFSEHNPVVVGVPAYRDKDDISLESMVKLPFEEQRSTWEYTGEVQ